MKTFALNFNNKRGIPIVTVHQTKQVGWEKARKNGFYQMNDLADTMAVPRNCNLVGYVLQKRDVNGDAFAHEIVAGVTKMRRGGVIKPFKLFAMFERSFICNMREDCDEVEIESTPSSNIEEPPF